MFVLSSKIQCKSTIRYWHRSLDHNLDCVDTIIVIDHVLQQAFFLDLSSETQRVNTTLYFLYWPKHSVKFWERIKSIRHADPTIPQIFLPARGLRAVWGCHGWEQRRLSASGYKAVTMDCHHGFKKQLYIMCQMSRLLCRGLTVSSKKFYSVWKIYWMSSLWLLIAYTIKP